MCDCRLYLWYTLKSQTEDRIAESLGRFSGYSLLLVFQFLWNVTQPGPDSSCPSLHWASSGQRIPHKGSQCQSLWVIVVSPRRSWEKWLSEAEKAWGSSPLMWLTPRESFSIESHMDLLPLFFPPPLQCIPILTMLLRLQAPLPWSPSWPAPSLLGHEEGGSLLHHLQVWQRKSPKQVRETWVHSLLLGQLMASAGGLWVCPSSHKEAARSENSKAFSSMNSVLPLLSTWTITFDFSKALCLT